MKKILLLSLVSTVVFMSCKDTDENKNQQLTTVDLASMDTTWNPNANFYQFAGGTWMANNPVPDSETRWGAFYILDEANKEKVNTLLSEASENEYEKGSVFQQEMF